MLPKELILKMQSPFWWKQPPEIALIPFWELAKSVQMPHASTKWNKRLAGHLAHHPESPSIIILSTNGAFRWTISQSIGSTRGVWSVSGEGGGQPAEQRKTLAAESHLHLHGFINSADTYSGRWSNGLFIKTWKERRQRFRVVWLCCGKPVSPTGAVHPPLMCSPAHRGGWCGDDVAPWGLGNVGGRKFKSALDRASLCAESNVFFNWTSHWFFSLFHLWLCITLSSMGSNAQPQVL